MSEIEQTDLLLRFHPSIRKYLNEIWPNGHIGICAGNFQLIKPFCSKCDEDNETKYANRFTLVVPYAGHFLEWDVIFSNDDLSFAPDFDFGNDAFLNDLDSETIIRYVPSLAEWDPNDRKALMNVIEQFLNLYKKYQVKLLDDDRYSLLNCEYLSLVEEAGLPVEDVEVFVEPNVAIHFLISMSVDFSCLPPLLQTNNDKSVSLGRDAAMLLVTFHGTNIQPQLFLSPHVEQAFGGTKSKHIPPFPADGSLMYYVPVVRTLLTNKVKQIVDNHTMKNKYISQLLAKYSLSAIEYDNTTYSKATLLFETKNFYWLLVIAMGNNFPREKPKWMLRSIYHMSFGKPYIETLDDYPYSPRWSPEEMINRAFTYTLSRVNTFQTNSIQKSFI